jgi:predicted ATPase/DNA-binding CsgD family transcriptional regulator
MSPPQSGVMRARLKIAPCRDRQAHERPARVIIAAEVASRVKDQSQAILLEPLTARELEILRLIARGLSNRAIAERLVVSVETVKWYNKRLYAKLDVSSRTQAVASARQFSLLREPSSQPEAAPFRHHLPAPLTSFLGREQDVRAVRRLLQTNRLVTLTGPGGTGKTRLALQVASEVAGDHQDGVLFVGLAALDDPDSVIATLAQSLGVGEQPGEPLLQTVQYFLVRKQMLLLLDNFEHLLPAAPSFSGLLAAAPRLSMLVTSREPLHLLGEQRYLVPPLALPAAETQLSTAAESPAVRLFHDRARAVRPGFTLDDENVGAVVQLCRLLDGLPLAIELAAARSRLFSPAALLARLQSPDHQNGDTPTLQLLSAGARDLPDRQQALSAAIDWSYHLLRPEEQALFRRLSVFAGGCTLEAVEAICNPGGETATHTIDLLSSLVEKSMLRAADGADGQPRLSLLHIMREYAGERQARLGEERQTRHRHALHYVKLAKEAQQQMRGPDQLVWSNRLEAEQDNLREALRWVMHHASPELALHAAPTFISSRFWRQRDRIGGVREWLETQLAASTDLPLQLRAAAVDTAARLAYTHGDYPATISLQAKGLVLNRELNDVPAAALGLIQLGATKMEMGKGDEARHHFEESLALARQVADPWLLGSSLLQLGAFETFVRNFPRAELLLDEALRVAYTVRNPRMLGAALFRIGGLKSHQGDYARARDYFDRALDVIRRYQGHWLEADTIKAIGKVAMRAGDFDEAATYLVRALTMFIEFNTWRIDGPEVLESLARVACEQDHDERAVRLWSAARRLRLGTEPWPIDKDYMEQAIGRVRACMPPATFDRAWYEGERLADEARQAPETLVAYASQAISHEEDGPLGSPRS